MQRTLQMQVQAAHESQGQALDAPQFASVVRLFGGGSDDKIVLGHKPDCARLSA